MSEQKSLRERAIEAGVAYAKAHEEAGELYDAAVKAVQELPENKALTEAVLRRQDRQAEFYAIAQDVSESLTILEQMEISRLISEQTGRKPLSLDEQIAVLSPDERKRYDEEVLALGETAIEV